MCNNFYCRENDEGEIWYYSTATQFQELLECLDQNEMEAALYREINDYKDEIIRQMELTDKITNQVKGNKKTYLDAENGNYQISKYDILYFYSWKNDHALD